MTYLVAAVVVVGVLCTLDLVLTLGVVRRLREHTERLSNLTGGPVEPTDMMLPKGEAVADFAAVTTSGESVSRAAIDGPTLVGFFSPTCEPCRRQAPQFAEFAGVMPGGRGRTLAVVVGQTDAAEEFAATFAENARVVIEPVGGTVSTAFKVDGFPAVCLLDEHGVIVDSSYRVDQLTALAAF